MAAAEHMPFREGSFDVVTAYSILHHMYDLPGMLAETRRVLRPGGWLYADESPNALCTRALSEADGAQGLDEGLQAEIQAVLADHTRYQARFGLDEDTVRAAMYRKYAHGGLVEDELRQTLEGVGFTDIRFGYRWVVGGSRLVRESGWEQQQAVEAHLRSLLPLTRHLFKYIQVIAA
jgi:ubiquinone/menaquinone biosynthesis C-methylase UbiE